MNLEKSLAVNYPELLRFWDYEKNLLSPSLVPKGSGKLYWWKCPNNIKEHSFEMSVHSRVIKTEICPYCSGKRINSSNSLAFLAPKIASLWHPTKNGDKTPETVHRFSKFKFWFICPKQHEFQSRPSDLKAGVCPICSGKQVSYELSLSKVRSEISQQWHPTKNKNLTPDQIYFNSSKKVWWICPFGHEFYTQVSARTHLYSGCKKCKSENHTSLLEQVLFYYLKIAFPRAENRFLYSTNSDKKIEFDIYIPSIQLAIEYDGYHHNNEKSIKRDQLKNSFCINNSIRIIRIRDTILPPLAPEATHTILFDYSLKPHTINCLVKQVIETIQKIYPFEFDYNLINFNRDSSLIMTSYIINKKNNSLAKKFPSLTKEWHPTKNHGLDPSMFMPYSSKSVWWQCLSNSQHEWKAKICNRSKLNTGCPYCANQKVSNETSLEYKYPNLIKLWNYDNNSPFIPSQVFPNSKKKVWWICPKNPNHDHLMSIAKKTAFPESCPYCHGKKVNTENALSSTHPELVKEWHPTLNTNITPNQITSGSGKRVFWQCKKNNKHIYEAPVKKRVAGRNCPYCAGKRVLPEESFAAKRPDLMKQWHPKNSIIPEEVSVNSNKRVWWRCTDDPNHVWLTSISSRKKATCPECQNKKVTPKNCLATTHPHLAIFWHKDKNSFSSHDVVAGSGKKAWFICKEQHETYEMIRQFVLRNGCRICRRLN